MSSGFKRRQKSHKWLTRAVYSIYLGEMMLLWWFGAVEGFCMVKCYCWYSGRSGCLLGLLHTAGVIEG